MSFPSRSIATTVAISVGMLFSMQANEQKCMPDFAQIEQQYNTLSNCAKPSEICLARAFAIKEIVNQKPLSLTSVAINAGVLYKFYSDAARYCEILCADKIADTIIEGAWNKNLGDYDCFVRDLTCNIKDYYADKLTPEQQKALDEIAAYDRSINIYEIHKAFFNALTSDERASFVVAQYGELKKLALARESVEIDPMDQVLEEQAQYMREQTARKLKQSSINTMYQKLYTAAKVLSVPLAIMGSVIALQLYIDAKVLNVPFGSLSAPLKSMSDFLQWGANNPGLYTARILSFLALTIAGHKACNWYIQRQIDQEFAAMLQQRDQTISVLR